jgi:hypothetical protein
VGALVVRWRGARVAGALGALLALPACGALNFRPASPPAGQDPDLEVSVESLAVVKPIQPKIDDQVGLQVGARVAARPGAAWGTPRIGAATDRPCAGGLLASGDVTSTWRSDPRQHALLIFATPTAGGAAPFAGGAAMLDVPVFPADRTQPGRCLRVPLQSGSVGTEWRANPWLFGLDLTVAFLARPLRGYQGSAVLFALTQGRWVGNWRLTVAFEGGGVDERGVAATPSSTRPTVGIFGAGANLGRMLWSGRRLGFDAQLGYDLLLTASPGAEATPVEAAAYERALLHGPRLALRILGLLAPRLDWPGFRAPPDATSVGLAAFAAAWWQSSGGVTPAPVFGFSLDGNIGF